MTIPDHTTDIPLKRCSNCGKDFLATRQWFHAKADSKDGFHTICKPCKHDIDLAYRETHKEKLRNRTHAYQASHREQRLAYGRIYRETHKNDERKKVWRRKYRQTHHERIKAYSHERRARKKASADTFSENDVKSQYKRQKGRCYWCNQKVGRTYHVDHVIPLSRGGTNGPENIVITCPTCNLSKRDRLPHEWAGNGGKFL